MPIYAYRCEDCGHTQDHMQKMSDPVLEVCPNCGKSSYRKQLSAPQFQLKGGGWYVTDFRDNGKKDAKKPASGDGATASDGGTSSSSSEAKSDAKSESKSDGGSSGDAAKSATSTASSASTSSSSASAESKSA